jgi:hypothetical protein
MFRFRVESILCDADEESMKHTIGYRERGKSAFVLSALAVAAAVAVDGVMAQQPTGQQTTPVQQQNVNVTYDSFQWEKSYVEVQSGPWTGARLPDGQPDVQGSWSNTIANHNHFADLAGSPIPQTVKCRSSLGRWLE